MDVICPSLTISSYKRGWESLAAAKNGHPTCAKKSDGWPVFAKRNSQVSTRLSTRQTEVSATAGWRDETGSAVARKELSPVHLSVETSQIWPRLLVQTIDAVEKL
jgi:hypothetical protein